MDLINHVKSVYLDRLSDGVTNLQSTGLNVPIPFKDSAEMAKVGKAKVGLHAIDVCYKLISWMEKEYMIKDHHKEKLIDEFNAEKAKAIKRAAADTLHEVLQEVEKEEAINSTVFRHKTEVFGWWYESRLMAKTFL